MAADAFDEQLDEEAFEELIDGEDLYSTTAAELQRLFYFEFISFSDFPIHG